MQWFPGSPPVLVDGAHNPAGIAAMVEAARKVLAGCRIVLVFAVMRNKDVDAMVTALRGLHAAEIVVTSPAVERATDVAELAQRFESAHTEPSVARALAQARTLAGREGAVVVAGSLYLAGEALSLLEA
jgi:dihydrofolate synthase/folylpolyglutamate synthase